MQKLRPFLIALLLAFPAFILSSCLEGDEEYWINADASGRLHLDYKIPPIVLKDLGDYLGVFAALREIDTLEDGLSINTLSAEPENGKIHFILDANFADARELFSLTEKHAAIFEKNGVGDHSLLQAALGKIVLEREGLDLHLRRELDLAPLFPDIIKRNPAILGPATFSYTIHLPTAASSSNAQETSADQRTVKWHAKLKDHTAIPIILELRAPLPIPKWVIAAVVGLIVAFLGLCYFLWSRRQKKSARH